MTLTLDLNLPVWGHVDRDAEFSDDRRYRYWLTRLWGSGPALMFVSLNPSDADEHKDDQTTRRDMDFAERFGYHAVRLLNLSDVVMTDPKAVAGIADPISSINDEHLDREAARHDLIVFAWGSNADPARARAVATRLWNICRRTGGAVACLGWTADGQPRHPSRLSKNTQLSTLTADAHPDFVDVDPRWVALLTDSDVLDSPARGVSR